MAVMEFPDYRKLYEEQSKETERWRNAAEIFRETLRDQFAMAALTGYMAYPNDCRSYKPSTEGTVEDFRRKCASEDAEYCYLMADAMIEARKAR